MPANDLLRQKFGRLSVKSRAENTLTGRARWLCNCVCGHQVTVLGKHLVSGHTQSCGCLCRERSQTVNMTHGQSKIQEYRIWRGIIKRCYNQKSRSYRYYGALGIKVDKRWRRSFANFIADMGPRPTRYHSIERKNRYGHYSKTNCIWATLHEQQRNKCSNRNITISGNTKVFTDWLIYFDIGKSTVRQRLRLGWGVVKALSTPPDKRFATKPKHS